MSEDIKEIPMDYGLALATYDSLNIMNAEATKMIEESDDLLPGVQRELESTIENTDIMAKRIGKEFGFEHGD